MLISPRTNKSVSTASQSNQLFVISSPDRAKSKQMQENSRNPKKKKTKKPKKKKTKKKKKKKKKKRKKKRKKKNEKTKKQKEKTKKQKENCFIFFPPFSDLVAVRSEFGGANVLSVCQHGH